MAKKTAKKAPTQKQIKDASKKLAAAEKAVVKARAEKAKLLQTAETEPVEAAKPAGSSLPVERGGYY